MIVSAFRTSAAKRLVIASLGVTLLTGSSLHAFGRREAGTSGAQFLKLPVNSRAIGMGEAYSSVVDGADAIYWNPARLSLVPKRAFSFMHAAYFQNISYDFASYAETVGALGTVALGAQYLNSGTLDGSDEFGTPAGTFQPNDLALSLGWGRKFSPHIGKEDYEFLIGITGKYIRSQITEIAQSGAVDFGISWKMLDIYSFSAVLQNVGSEHKFKGESATLPINAKLGYSVIYWQALILALDVNFPRDNDPVVGAGAEYKKTIGKGTWLAGRAGYNSRSAADISAVSSVSFGAGLGWNAYGIDFAWVPFGDLGHTYRFSLSVKY